MSGGDDLLAAELVRRVAIAVKEDHGDRGDAGGDERVDGLLYRLFVKRRDRMTGGRHALDDLETMAAGDQRRGPVVLEVVHRGPVGPAYLIDVAKSLRGQQAYGRVLALQERIEPGGRAVDEELDLGTRRDGVVEHLENPGREMPGRRQRLGRRDAARARCCDEVGERAPYVDRDCRSSHQPRQYSTPGKLASARSSADYDSGADQCSQAERAQHVDGDWLGAGWCRGPRFR